MKTDLKNKNRTILEYANSQKYLLGHVQGRRNEMIIEQLENIYYFESQGHDISMVSKTGSFKVDKPLREIEEILPKYVFQRVSNAAIVNMRQIKKITQYSQEMQFILLMPNGVQITVTRKNYKMFKGSIGLE